MKKIFTLALIMTVLLVLSGCSSTETVSDLERIGLDGLSAKEILQGLEDGSIEVDGYGVSVYDHELLVLLDDKQISIEMPEDEFYVSVAPFIDLTHDCLFHSATGCRGELKNELFFVEFTTNDGTVIISEEYSSGSNGFIDLWLPRNVEGTLTITQGDLSTSKVITTNSGDPTCETTMQLT